MKNLSVAALLGAIALVFGGAGDVSAGMIAIVNHSFEDEVLPDGYYNNGVQGWTQGGASIYGIGTWNATLFHFNDLTSLDGDQHVYLNGGQIAQQLTTGVVLGKTYRLSALFGQLGQGYQLPAGGSLQLWADGAVAGGDVTGGTLLGSLNVSDSDLPYGTFSSFQTDIVAPTSGLLGGELLSIRFVSNGRESQIDNIQLSTLSTSVPEPTSLAFLGLASLGGLGLRLRRRRGIAI